MSSIVRATAVQVTRRLIVLASAVFAVVVAQAQMLVGWGQTPAEFSADSDATLRVAGYAFSIWGVIYVAILAYAVRQAMRQTGESLLIHRFGWPSIVAFLGIGWWVVAAAFDWEAATVVLIFGSLAALLLPLLHNADAIRALGRTERDRWLVVWPLALLAGWLTVAAPLNLLTVLTGNEALPAAPGPTVWAMLAVVVVALVALGMTARLRMLAYALPVAWGLLGAFVAEQERNPPLAYAALAATAAVLVGAVILTFRLRPGVERANAD
ncbi:hypothetical protein [Brevundimonas sp.]|uniref:hypothetical protein n=1 Tax=Brevundimonas sp. TaxID=1871086 RepID=UPI002D223AA3|nr:hypothetical protein [Brevundimonas sp.]HYC74280.1 hypothetical protein [Brevundimonas sp.]